MPNPMQQVRLTSLLHTSPAVLWQHVSTLSGVNEELWPLHMSGPAEARFDEHTPLGRRLFRSRLTLLRVLPLDLHDLSFEHIEVGRGFRESSRSLLERRWQHVRTITSAGPYVRIEDALAFEPRLLGSLVRVLIERVFERRHERLVRKFGGARET